jgi:hypothetical protein
VRARYGHFHVPASLIAPGAGVEIRLTERGLVDGVRRLLGLTREEDARDWLIAKVAAWRGESEATTTRRLTEL